MTKVICSMVRCDGPLFFDCKDHSDYKNPDTGNNDVCVATSTLCSMLVRYIVGRGYTPTICEDGHVRIDISQSCPYINEVFNAVMIEFKALQDEFPEHIKVY